RGCPRQGRATPPPAPSDPGAPPVATPKPRSRLTHPAPRTRPARPGGGLDQRLPAKRAADCAIRRETAISPSGEGGGVCFRTPSRGWKSTRRAEGSVGAVVEGQDVGGLVVGVEAYRVVLAPLEARPGDPVRHGEPLVPVEPQRRHVQRRVAPLHVGRV